MTGNALRRIAQLLANKSVAWAVVIISLLLTASLSYFALRVERDDDLLAFLPVSNSDVVNFRRVNERFGGLDVGIVGIAVADPFTGSFLEKLEALTHSLNDDPNISVALSLSNTEDFVADAEKGGIRADYLVRPLPKNAEESAKIRARVMSRQQVVGQLVSPSGDAVIIYAFLAPGASPRLTANAVRAKVREVFPEEEIYWGGAPFISTYIYDTTLEDMTRLIPWAVAVIIVLIVLSFRDVVGAGLALLSTGMGIGVTHGLMGLFGVDANIVLSSMPVILFAVGSAYAIHVLVRYYALRATSSCEEALVDTLTEIGPTVLAAGLTTVAGLMSFMAMDIQPMREFGLFTGLGILATLVFSLTFVPAVVRLTDLRARTLAESVFVVGVKRLTLMAQRRRWPLTIGLAVVALAGATMAGRVEARMENSAFFAAGSPPDLAEHFLDDKFGGSQFVQVQIEADMNDPAVLRKLQFVADRIAMLPAVSQVTHVGQILSLVNEAFSGERRIPVTGDQVRVVYRFLLGRPAVEQLVDADRTHALLMVKVGTSSFDEVAAVLARIEEMTASAIVVAGAEDLVATRIAAQVGLPSARLGAIREAIAAAKSAPPDNKRVSERLEGYLTSEESLLEDAQQAQAGALAAALVALGPGASSDAQRAAVAASLPAEEGEDPEDHAALIDDIARATATPLAELWRKSASRAVADQVIAALGLELDEATTRAVAFALLDARLPDAAIAPDGTLQYLVTGTPVLYRGLSTSVTANQFKSLGLALGLVLLIMVVLFRSLASGLLAAAPTVVTLLVVYGYMGARGMHLDIGTSMLASIIIGAGVDYAVHLLAAWRSETDLQQAAEHAAQHAGPAIWINALMVAAGFFVLTRGDARPLQNVGGLTSAAMITAALATFLVVPALARKLSYRNGTGGSAGGSST